MTEFLGVENRGTGLLPILRVARPTDRLEQVTRFYRDGLGFAEIGRFVDHDGFDGVVLGAPHAPYHLEFTHRRGQSIEISESFSRSESRSKNIFIGPLMAYQ